MKLLIQDSTEILTEDILHKQLQEGKITIEEFLNKISKIK